MNSKTGSDVIIGWNIKGTQFKIEKNKNAGKFRLAGSWTGESEEDMKDYRHTEFCKADRTTWKLTLQGINTTPKEPRTVRGLSRRRLFRPFGNSSVRRNE